MNKKDSAPENHVGEDRFLEDGQQIHVHAVIPGGFVVQNIMEHDGDEFHGGDKYVVERVFITEPTDVFSHKIEELQADIFELQHKRDEIQREIVDLEGAKKSQVQRFKKTKGLELLEDYLDGKITHFMECHYGSKYSITEFKEQPVSEIGPHQRCEMKLLSLFGNSKGDLTWRRDQYSDGSGGSRQEVVPCRSYEEARQEIQKRLDAIEWVKLDDHQLSYPIKTADEFSLTIPDPVRKRNHEYEIKCLSERLQKNQAEGEAIRQEMNKIIGTAVA